MIKIGQVWLSDEYNTSAFWPKAFSGKKFLVISRSPSASYPWGIKFIDGSPFNLAELDFAFCTLLEEPT